MLSGYCYCQSEGKKDTIINQKHKNAFYVEIIGNALLYSLNYERVIFSKRQYNTAVRIGASYFGFLGNHIICPVEINEYWKKKNHGIELGIGTTVRYSPRDEEYVVFSSRTIYNHVEIFATARVGYRFQLKTGDKTGIIIRVGIMPLMVVYDNKYKKDIGTFIPPFPVPGLSGGITF